MAVSTDMQQKVNVILAANIYDYTTHKIISMQLYADEFQPRTKLTHEQICRLLKGPLKQYTAKTYGLNRDSILNSSRYFHVVDGLAPDIMHNILEGSLQFEVQELLKHCIQTEAYFTLELNTVIEEFPYVLSDKANKPA